MVATNTTTPFDLVVTTLSPAAPTRSSISSLSSTHSRNSFRKQPTRNRRRVRFAPPPHPAADDDFSHSCGTDSTTTSTYSSTETASLAQPHSVHTTILYYDPAITPDNAPDVFYSAAEILQTRREVRKVASKFATDYPAVVDALDHLYQTAAVSNGDSDDGGIDLRAMHATLRRRRKRLQTMELAQKWDSLFNAFGDDDDDDAVEEDEEDDNSTDGNASSSSFPPSHYFCDDDAPEDHLHYGVTRGLEARIVAAVGRGDRRRESIQSVLELQNELRRSNTYTDTQIERCLCARAVQLTRKARMFAFHQALLDVMDLEESPSSSSPSSVDDSST